jgi:arylsulfatase A-like enzyme
MIRRRVVLSLILGLLLLGGACDKAPVAAHGAPRVVAAAAIPAPRSQPAPPPSPPKKPNILIVVIDTLRYDASQLDPESRNATPFLASLRDRGVNFTRCYTTEDSTPPAHFSLLTGYVSGWTGPLDVPQASLAYQLRRHGYHTFGVAANGNLTASAFRAVSPFDDFVDLPTVFESMSPREKAAARKKAEGRLRAYGMQPDDFDEGVVWSSADKVLSHAQRPLRRARQPFFGFLNYLDAHDPYYPDPRSYDISDEEVTVPSLRTRTLSDELLHPENIADPQRRTFVTGKIEQAMRRAWTTDLDLTKAQVAVYRKRYLAEIREFDDAMRKLFELLEAQKLLDSTIVIVTSDHGESFGEQNLITHSFGNRGNVEATNHVPLLILFPPSYAIRPRAINSRVTLADVPPMVYDLIGSDWSWIAANTLPANYGLSLLPYILSGTLAERFSQPQPERPQQWQPVPASAAREQALKRERRLRSLGYLQ